VRDALARLQAQLTQLAEAQQQQQQQQQQQAAAAAAPEGCAGSAGGGSSSGAGWEAALDGVAGQLWELRVELQNEVAGLSGRLEGVEGLRGDMDIWGDSLKGVARRAEEAAAEAVEKVGVGLEEGDMGARLQCVRQCWRWQWTAVVAEG
jgi:hypothetical protein